MCIITVNYTKLHATNPKPSLILFPMYVVYCSYNKWVLLTLEPKPNLNPCSYFILHTHTV